MPKVCFDPGHSRQRPGAHGPSGLQEHEVVFDIAQRAMHAAKEAGWDAIITRGLSNDIAKGSPAARARLANDAMCHYLVSIHCNAGDPGSPTAKGIEVYYDDQHPMYRDFADVMVNALREVRGVVHGNPVKMDNQGAHSTLSVLDEARMPAILVELGFISNPDEEKMLADPKSREVLAMALFEGVKRYHEERGKSNA